MQYGPIHSLPVYRKSLALYDLSKAVATYFSRNKEFFPSKKTASFRDDLSDSLLTDADLIIREIATAATSTSYTSRMKSLTFINIMTRNILSYCNGLERDGVKEKEYLNLLRGEIKSFRKSFKSWRKSFLNGED